MALQDKENTGQNRISQALSNAMNFVGAKEKLGAENDVLTNTTSQLGNAIFEQFKKNKNRTFDDLVKTDNLVEKANEAEKQEKINEAVSKETVANAMSETAKTLYTNSENTSANFMSTATKTDVSNEVTKQEAKDDYDVNQIISSISYPAQAAMEKLGVQDYFPNIAENIAVGSWTGSRLGSQTIYAAPGMIIPAGLIDARKRAFQETVKAKKAALAKIQELPNAPEQFNQAFKLKGHEVISGYLERNNYDPEKFFKDKEALGALYRLQTTAEAMKNVDKIFDDLVQNQIKEGQNQYYISKDVMDLMIDFRSGKAENLDAYLSGEKNVSELLNNMRSYSDGSRMVDRNIVEILKNPRTLPVNLKKGTQIDQAAMDEITAARKEINGGVGYDAYLNVIKKYYDVDVNTMVDSWMDNAGYSKDDPARQWTKDYALSRIPRESLEAKFEYQANKDYDYWKARGDWAREDEEKMAYWETVNQQSINQNVADKISSTKSQIDDLNNRIIAIRAGGGSQEEKTRRITELRRQRGAVLANAYNDYSNQFGGGMKVEQDEDGNVYGVVKVNRETQKSTATVGNKKAMIYVATETIVNGKRTYSAGKSVSIEDFRSHVRFDKDGNATYDKGWVPTSRGSGASAYEYDKEMQQVLTSSYSGALSLSANEHKVTAAYNNGRGTYKVNTGNVGNYSASENKTMIVSTSANPVIKKEGVDSKGNPMYGPAGRVVLTFETDLNNTPDRQVIEEMSTVVQDNTSKFIGDE